MGTHSSPGPAHIPRQDLIRPSVPRSGYRERRNESPLYLRIQSYHSFSLLGQE